MRILAVPAFAIAVGAGLLAAPQAQARFSPAQVEAPSLVEDAQCVRRQIRTVRPNGRVVYRTVTDCGVRRGWDRMDGCRVVRERVYRPNGNVVTRTVRRCR